MTLLYRTKTAIPPSTFLMAGTTKHTTPSLSESLVGPSTIYWSTRLIRDSSFGRSGRRSPLGPTHIIKCNRNCLYKLHLAPQTLFSTLRLPLNGSWHSCSSKTNRSKHQCDTQPSRRHYLSHNWIHYELQCYMRPWAPLNSLNFTWSHLCARLSRSRYLFVYTGIWRCVLATWSFDGI